MCPFLCLLSWFAHNILIVIATLIIYAPANSSKVNILFVSVPSLRCHPYPCRQRRPAAASHLCHRLWADHPDRWAREHCQVFLTFLTVNLSDLQFWEMLWEMTPYWSQICDAFVQLETVTGLTVVRGQALRRRWHPSWKTCDSDWKPIMCIRGSSWASSGQNRVFCCPRVEPARMGPASWFLKLFRLKNVRNFLISKICETFWFWKYEREMKHSKESLDIT